MQLLEKWNKEFCTVQMYEEVACCNTLLEKQEFEVPTETDFDNVGDLKEDAEDPDFYVCYFQDIKKV